MKKRRGGLLQRMMAVLFAVVLTVGMVSDVVSAGVPVQEGSAAESLGNEGTESETISTNDTEPASVAEPQRVMMAAAPAPQADNIASGNGWVLDADGKLTISSDAGMEEWSQLSSVSSYRSQVKSAEILDGVTSIGDQAFYGCSSLTEIMIPASVTGIGNDAFWGCTSLATVTMQGEPPTLGTDVFGKWFGENDKRCKFVPNNTKGIRVPEGKAQAYKDAWTDWSAYIADDMPTHTHPVCGASCSEHSDTHNAVEWKVLSQDSFTGGTDGGPKEGSGVSIEKYYETEYRLAPGNYYLTENITVDKIIKLADGAVNLCLNGHTLTSTVEGNKDSISFFENGANTSNGTLNLCDCGSGGKITGGSTRLLYVNKGTTANLYGGTLTNLAGHCVIVYEAATLLLDGATLVTNATIADQYAINMQGGSVTIKSGTVESTHSHAVMIVPKGSFTMEGGTVKTTGSAFPGGPCALYFAGKDYLGNISGGTISGGTIQSVNGPGIHLTNPSKVILSGSPQISGKTADVSLQTVADTALDGAQLDASAYSGQALRATEYDPSAAVGAYAIKGGKGKFTLTNNGYTYQYENGGWVIRKEHTHAWATTWTISATHHWHECSAAGCPVTENSGKDGYGGHVYDNDQDTTCNTCNYTRTVTPSHTHNYGDWQHNDTQHWKVCACGNEAGRGNHDFGNWITDQEATATEAGTKHRECQTCGYSQTETIPATGGDPGSGTVTLEAKLGTNAPATNISTPAEELKDMLLTDEEKQQVQNGTNIRIVLEVQDAGNTVSASDKEAVAQALNGFTVGQYLNIDLYKLAEADRTDIHETAKKIRIVIAVPEALRNADSSKTRTFAVVRVHDGRAELLADLDGSADTITIETDRFSTYAIVYKDTANDGSGGGNNGNDDNNGSGNNNGGSGNNGSGNNGGNNNSSSNNSSQNNSGINNTKPDSSKDNEPKTGDAAPLEIYATLAMIAGFTWLLLYFTDREKGMTEETKKELVSRIVRWAKRGGRIRKRLALALIFVLLVYYHSIGKKTCSEWQYI